MSRVDDIVKRLSKEDFFDALRELDRLAGSKDAQASDIIDKFVAVKQDSITENQKFQLKTKIANGTYANLHFDITPAGTVFIAASKNKQLARKRRQGKKKIAVAACVAVLVVMAGLFVYVNFIKERELESMTMAGEGAVYSSALNELSLDFIPHNASDKKVVWTTDNDKVKLTPDGSKVSYAIDPSVESGTTFTITATNEKYGVTTSRTITVTNDIAISVSSPADVAIGDFFVLQNSSNSPLNPHISWTCTDSRVSISEVDSQTNISISDSSSIGNKYTITGTIDGTGIVKSFEVTVAYPLGITLDYSCPFKDILFGPNSSMIVTGQEFTINPTLKSASNNIVWSVSYPGISYTSEGTTLKCKVNSVENIQTATITATIFGTSASSNIVLDLRDGTLVTSPDELNKMNGTGRYFIANDIDLTNYPWVPYEFKGELISAGIIKNLSINAVQSFSKYKQTTGSLYYGMFSKNTGTIIGLVIDGVSIKVAPNNLGAQTTVYAGSVAGDNTGTILGCVVNDADIKVYSSNIKTSWLSSHSGIPSPPSSERKAGVWYEYASLQFTGLYIQDWADAKPMEVFVGGIVGHSSSTLDQCQVSSSKIYGEVINFNAAVDNQDCTCGTYRAYIGGISGQANVSNCESTKNEVTGVMTLHDSKDGTIDGLGYGGIGGPGSFQPPSSGYIGKLTGSGSKSSSTDSSTTVNYSNESYAPVYVFAYGSAYDDNKGSTSNMKWAVN